MTTSSPLWSARVAASGRRTEMSGGGAEAFMPHCPSAEAAGLTPYLVVASAAATLAWLARDRTLHRGRYTTVCIATLAVAVGLYEIGVATGAATAAGGLMASIAAGQLYTVAGIRKLRSPAFMSGRVLVDNVAFCAWRAYAGDRGFVPLVPRRHLPTLLCSGGLRRGCRVAAGVAVGAEILVGAGAIGLLPFGVTIALAVPLHVGFLLLGPSRLLPFTAGALGLLFLSAAAPLVPIWG